jgi:stress-induced morphogen
LELRKDHPMPMQSSEIESLIKAAFPDADVTMTALASDDDHWAAAVVSSAFKGKTRVQQHQMVYAALKGRMGGVLHALSLQTAPKD